jgi:uncharacterized membrane protein
MKTLRKILGALRIVISKSGRQKLNWANPLTYVVLTISSVYVFFYYGATAVVEHIKDNLD